MNNNSILHMKGQLDKSLKYECWSHGHRACYVKLRIAHAPGMPGTFFPPPWVSDPDMHHGTCVTHVSRCMPGSLTNGFFWSRWRGKRSRHSRRMSNPHIYVYGKRPMTHVAWWSFLELLSWCQLFYVFFHLLTHPNSCMQGSLINGFFWSQWRGKRSRYSRRMRNPQFYVSGKRPMGSQEKWLPGMLPVGKPNAHDVKRKLLELDEFNSMCAYIFIDSWNIVQSTLFMIRLLSVK